MAKGTTRPPHSATRYIETEVGILSYQELAPWLVERVEDAEVEILEREFAEVPVSDLLLRLHERICADLAPEIAGRWRLRSVQVGAHEAPPHERVPVLMRNYAADLDARMASLLEGGGEVIDVLTFLCRRVFAAHPSVRGFQRSRFPPVPD